MIQISKKETDHAEKMMINVHSGEVVDPNPFALEHFWSIDEMKVYTARR